MILAWYFIMHFVLSLMHAYSHLDISTARQSGEAKLRRQPQPNYCNLGIMLFRSEFGSEQQATKNAEAERAYEARDLGIFLLFCWWFGGIFYISCLFVFSSPGHESNLH
mmetsp:Transcript_14053/g.40060  ORF Transcript_14053/g.40060 Transcript_14053/m.40060 type:complete len:109 (-) Transcript_14053:754-1080(-)